MVNHRDSLRGTQRLKQPITVLAICKLELGGKCLKCLLMETEIDMVEKEGDFNVYENTNSRSSDHQMGKYCSVIALSLPQADLISYVCWTAILTRSNLKRCLATFTCIAQLLSVSSKTNFLHSFNKIVL